MILGKRKRKKGANRKASLSTAILADFTDDTPQDNSVRVPAAEDVDEIFNQQVTFTPELELLSLYVYIAMVRCGLCRCGSGGGGPGGARPPRRRLRSQGAGSEGEISVSTAIYLSIYLSVIFICISLSIYIYICISLYLCRCMCDSLCCRCVSGRGEPGTGDGAAVGFRAVWPGERQGTSSVSVSPIRVYSHCC